jgi:C_GCAxxG_C_C family probable redox protein
MNSKSVLITKAQTYFDEGYACSQSVLLAFSDHFNLDERTAKIISSTFGGGMGRLRQKCGAVTSGFMVLGLAYGNEIPTDMETKLYAYKKVRELDNQFREIYGTTSCKELLQKYASQSQVEERKHHQIICKQVVSDATGLVFDLLKQDEKI